MQIFCRYPQRIAAAGGGLDVRDLGEVLLQHGLHVGLGTARQDLGDESTARLQHVEGQLRRCLDQRHDPRFVCCERPVVVAGGESGSCPWQPTDVIIEDGVVWVDLGDPSELACTDDWNPRALAITVPADATQILLESGILVSFGVAAAGSFWTYVVVLGRRAAALGYTGAIGEHERITAGRAP